MLRRLIGSSLIYGLGDLVSRLLVFAAVPIYTALLTPEEYGRLGLLLTIGALVGALGSLGINNAVQRFWFETGTDTRAKHGLAANGWLVQGTSLVLVFALVGAGAVSVSGVLPSSLGLESRALLLALGGAVFAQLVQYGVDLFRLEFRPWAFSLAQVLRGGGATVLAVVLIAGAGLGIEGILVANLLVFTLLSVVLMIGAGRRYGWSVDLPQIPRLLDYGWPFIPVALLAWGQASIDRWLISSLADLTATGVYTLAASFAGLLGFIVAAFAQAWSPLALKLRQDDPGNYRRRYADIWVVWGYALLVLGSGLMLFAPEVLRVLTGPAWHGAAPLLVVLAAAAALSGSLQVTGLGISISCRTGIFAGAAAVALLVSSLAGVLLIPRIGALGAALATLVAQLLLTCIYTYWSQRLHPLPLRWPALLALGACGSLVLISALAASVQPWAWWHPVAKAPALVVFAALLWWRLGMRNHITSLAPVTA